MDELTQTISNLVGILLGVVGAVGVGFFIYGAYMYLTASGAPNQMERGKSAMMNAVVGSPVEIDLPDPATPTPTPTN